MQDYCSVRRRWIDTGITLNTIEEARQFIESSRQQARQAEPTFRPTRVRLEDGSLVEEVDRHTVGGIFGS